MQLYATETNPIPEGAVVSTVRTRDGVRLRAARWAPTAARSVGSMLLINGRAEMIEKYFETIADLRARGFHVATFDWRGQGGSDRALKDGRKGHVRDFSEFDEDLRAFVEAEMTPHCPKPWFGLAHSMGACVALSALHAGTLPLERIVCIAPMVAIHGVANPTGVLWLARSLRAIGMGGRYIPGGGATSIATKPFERNPLTTDATRYARNSLIASDYPELAIGDPTVSWTRAAFARMREFAGLRYPLEILTPALVLAAGDDRIVSTPAVEAFASRLKAGSAITIPGGRHELLMERDALRAQVFAAIDAFLPGSGAPPQLVAATAGKRR
ncbi:alpha/beta hydrolase [Terrarubrum flagellatum]|uniref:alpha/beta hydrolase n=1 Tax=Terrirubrum flagellatum TaxID=2895980 RepID=UPI0031452626